MYTLEEMISRFLKDAKEAEENNKRLLKEWKETYPNEPTPEYIDPEFNLARALAGICAEILALKSSRSPISEDRVLRVPDILEFETAEAWQAELHRLKGL